MNQATSALPPAILLMGPTTSGKTALAMALTVNFPVELISVDSAQIYRDMNVGTAKPSPAELRQFPHHLIDILSPEERYSAAQFCRDALSCMADIQARGKIPLLVGGTMLYFRALMEGLADLPQASPTRRAALEAEAARLGWPALHQRLQQLDPETAQRLHPSDSQRIQRALEICLESGQSMSSLLKSTRSEAPFRFISLALLPSNRGELHTRIAQRFDQMLSNGLNEEVSELRHRYTLSLDLPSMRCVGYRQTWEAQDGLIPKGELRERGIYATRQLAKRQITWLTNSFEAAQFDCLSPDLHTQARTHIAQALNC